MSVPARLRGPEAQGVRDAITGTGGTVVPVVDHAALLSLRAYRRAAAEPPSPLVGDIPTGHAGRRG
jgi:hypothetical protein